MTTFRSPLACAGFLTLVFGFATGAAPAQRTEYPPTRTVETVDTYHGIKVPDPYRWLEEIDSPGVADAIIARALGWGNYQHNFVAPRI